MRDDDRGIGVAELELSAARRRALHEQLRRGKGLGDRGRERVGSSGGQASGSSR